MLNFDLPDLHIYNHVDYCSVVSEQLSLLDQSSITYIAVPQKYDHSKLFLPVFLATKENDSDNKHWNTKDNGYIIFSSLHSGDIKIIKLFESTGKNPLPKKEKLVFPEGYTPKTTTFYNCYYKDIPSVLLPKSDPKWSISIQTVSNISNAHIVNFNNPISTEDESPFHKKITSSEGSLTADEHEKFEMPLNPKPNYFGFSMKSPPKTLNINESFIVNGEFNLSAENTEHLSFIPIHVLLTSKDFHSPRAFTLLVPKSKVRFYDNRLHGTFSFDLTTELKDANSNSYYLSDEIFITFVSRGEYSFPKLIVNELIEI